MATFNPVVINDEAQSDEIDLTCGGNEKMTRKRLTIQTAISLATGMMMAASMVVLATASAGEMATAADISAAVSDHTYQGSMTEDSFVEYYEADGAIRGKDYSGKWRTLDGAMCFQYGDKPEKCWDVELSGPAMTMFKDGKVDGNGMLIEGNPNNF